MNFMAVPDLVGGRRRGVGSGVVEAISSLDGRGQAVLMELIPAVSVWGLA